jgi:hypothetical protein
MERLSFPSTGAAAKPSISVGHKGVDATMWTVNATMNVTLEGKGSAN